MVEVSRNTFSINTRIIGDQTLVADIERYLTEKFPKTNRLIKSLTGGMFGIDVVDELLPLARTETVASALHYPHLPTTGELLRDFMNSKAKVLVLIGPPGTGKSTYLRAMIGDLDSERHLYTAAAASVHANPQLLEIMKRSAPNSVFVFEDADLLISARDSGNHQMSEILNITDGITTSDRKFIFSTNLPNLKSVDKALLRPGRCFGTYGFRSLTADEARPVYKEHNLIMPEDYTDSTLAEILNPPNHIGDYSHE
jgi:SpoVK/Ycf46/Vps4 family AAA+-type ATPase